MKLYRLKSNPQTIVKRDGVFHRVFWSKSMLCGYNSDWMVSRWNEENVEELNEEEAKIFIDLKNKIFPLTKSI